MFRIFQEEKIVTACMAGFFAASIFTRLLLGFLYRNMIRETDNMASTRNKLLKQCKLKFANCFQLNNGVANIPVFVDKFLNRLSVGPLTFETMYHLSGQLMLLSVVSAGVGVCRSILGGRMLGEILPFYIVSFLGLYVYFSVSTVVDVKGKRSILKTNLVDYLENHLSARMDVTENDMEMLFGRSAYGRPRSGKRGGRRTVELMPIGGRLAIGEPLDVVEEENLRMLDGAAAGGRERADRSSEGGRTSRESGAGVYVGADSVARSSGQEMPDRQPGGQDDYEKMARLREARRAQGRAAGPAQDMEAGSLVDGIRREVRRAAESQPEGEIFTKDQEQELEELLKEFLTS